MAFSFEILLLIFYVSPLCAKVFAFGNKQYYDRFIHTSNKSYYQIDKNIFQIDIDSSQFDFDYFTDFTVVLSRNERILLDNPYSSTVLFLDDHGNESYFSRIRYFQLYKMFLKYPNNEFLIFNDSYNSLSMIDLIKFYNQIHESKIFQYMPKDIGGQVLFSFLNLFNSISESKNPLKEARELIEFYQKSQWLMMIHQLRILI